MNYKRIHDLIIERAQSRILEIGYTEKHHIIPKSLGGSDKKINLVNLTLKEHYIIHLLLVKIYPNVPELVYAAWMMSNRGKIKGAAYAYLRENYLKIRQERISAKIKEDPEYLKKIASKSKGIPKKNKENYRGSKSKQTREKMSISALQRQKVSCDLCGKIVSIENLSNHKKAHTGSIIHDEEMKKKISEGVKRIPRITCSICPATINPSNMWRHMKKHERLNNDLQCI